MNSGYVTFSFWTADKTEPINNVKVTTGGTAAGATPTLCRMGIYSVNAAGDLTALLAATANDTSLFAAANTVYTRALTTQFNKVAGQRYATALLVVTGAAMPKFIGASAPSSTTVQWGHLFELPTLASRVLGQTDLAASYTRAQQGACTSTPRRLHSHLIRTDSWLN